MSEFRVWAPNAKRIQVRLASYTHEMESLPGRWWLANAPEAPAGADYSFMVDGGEKEDFHLFEDGVEQNVAHFSGEDAPLSVGLVFDESGSMDYKLRTSREAAAQFLKTLNTDDEAFLVEFGDSAKLSVGFTAHTEEIQSVLKNAHPAGLTAMLDAINTGLHEMKKAKNPRKAIVIVSDGGDNHSQYTAAEIESLVREADVQIYAMGVFEPVLSFGLTPEEISGPRLLSEIAAQTGGRAFAAAVPSDLPSVAARIAVELRNQYVLAYYPTNQAKDGKYRKVELKLSQPPGITSAASARTGPGKRSTTRCAARYAAKAGGRRARARRSWIVRA